MPISAPNMSCSSENCVPPKKNVKGINWTDEETKVFLEIFLDKKIISLLDGKKFKHIDIFKSLEKEMLARGFWKTAQQMKLKMTKLKQLYFKCKRDNQKSGSDRKCFQFFDELDAIYGDRPNLTVPDSEDVIDTGDETRMNDSLEPEEAFVEAVVHDVPADFQVAVTPEIVYVNEITPEVDSMGNKAGEKYKSRKKGKKSYTDQVEEIQKNTMKVLSEFCLNQSNLTADLMRSENEKQRQWELELLQREHTFQQSQMELLLRTIQFQQMPPISPYPSYVPHPSYFSGSNDGSQRNPVHSSELPSTSKRSGLVCNTSSPSAIPASEVKESRNDSIDSSDDSSPES